MLLNNRHGSVDSDVYRFGFQGQERDDEIKGEGNSYNYTFRIHDPRVGRFFAVDPLYREYPHNSPYAFSENVVINAVELEGLEKEVIVDNSNGLPRKINNNYHVITGKEARDNEYTSSLIKVLNDNDVINENTVVTLTLTGFTTQTVTTGPWYWRSMDHQHLSNYEVSFQDGEVPISFTVQLVTGASTHVEGSNPLDYILIYAGGQFMKLAESTIAKNVKQQIKGHFTKELSKLGIKYNADDILRIGRNQSGKISFLETGSSKAGLEHIIKKHGDDFVKNGVAKDDIADFVFDASTKGTIVGYQGKGTGRPIYEYMYKGEAKRVAVTTSENGFIVGANPVSIK